MVLGMGPERPQGMGLLFQKTSKKIVTGFLTRPKIVRFRRNVTRRDLETSLLRILVAARHFIEHVSGFYLGLQPE